MSADDLDPPSFQFQHAGKRRRRDEDGGGADERGGAEERPEPSEPEGERPPDAPPADPAPTPVPAAGAEAPLGAPPSPARPEPRVIRTADAPGSETPRPRGGFLRGETARRVLWALPLAIFAIVIIGAGGILFAAAMAGFGIVGLRELFAMTRQARPLAPPAYLAVTAMVIAAHFGDPFHILMAFAASFPAIFVFAARREDRNEVTLSISVTLLGIAWLGMAFAHAVLLRELPDHGSALLIDVLVATIAADTAAYGGGRLFGTRKITPRISPNKTLEGMIAGFLGGTLGFWIAGLYQDWLAGTDALLMGMAVGLMAPIGDLFVSMLKRDSGTKDTGTIFGPHGGVLDRLDAITFTVVLGYYLSVAFVY